MEFDLVYYASVSTAYLTDSDIALLGTAPGHLARVDDHGGHFLYLRGADLEGETELHLEELKQCGMSEKFLAIIRELCRQRIAYVRFDTNGSDIQGLDPVDDEDEGDA